MRFSAQHEMDPDFPRFPFLGKMEMLRIVIFEMEDQLIAVKLECLYDRQTMTLMVNIAIYHRSDKLKHLFLAINVRSAASRVCRLVILIWNVSRCLA